MDYLCDKSCHLGEHHSLEHFCCLYLRPPAVPKSVHHSLGVAQLRLTKLCHSWFFCFPHCFFCKCLQVLLRQFLFVLTIVQSHVSSESGSQFQRKESWKQDITSKLTLSIGETVDCRINPALTLLFPCTAGSSTITLPICISFVFVSACTYLLLCPF